MLAKLGVAVHLQDIEVLKAAIKECQAAGMPEQALEEAMVAKVNIERMLAKLRAAIDLQDMDGVKTALEDCGVDMLKMAIEQCRVARVPEAVLEEAMTVRARLALNLPEHERARLLDGLKSCSDEERRAAYNEAVSMLHEAIRTGSDVPPQFEELMNELIIQQVI